MPLSSRAGGDLRDAIVEEQRRKAVDDAKKRAVAQHVDYDTFRNMARPMLPAWRLDAEGRQLPDGGASKERQPPDAAAVPQPPPQGRRAAAPPDTAAEFEREWRRRGSPQERWEYLMLTTPERLPQLFRVEMGGRLLGEVVEALESRWREGAAAAGKGSNAEPARCEAADVALRTLQALTECGRFGLASRLLSRGHKAAAVALLASLDAHAALAEAPCSARSGGGGGGAAAELKLLREAFGA
ncbi:hypothetical protein Rsub_06347 [Raphidocelis subcapitata]|uniref:Uncharacterized protein n=1 Tax=Raphidocelis subcapitata TaxID=307507 RepID=A0A2V0P960_9CHLO|nr:hypothetical protein Rsub_06347 [Raphidocelis subcapitata]|eukprot:GBF93625.1 hypothetical protein Rsub_06347 [Raphidocelis subcapitata]